MSKPFETVTDMSKPGIYKPDPDKPGVIVLPDNFDTVAEVDKDKVDVVLVPEGRKLKVYFHRRV